MMKAAPKRSAAEVGIGKLRRGMEKQMRMIPVPAGVSVEETELAGVRCEWVCAEGVAGDTDRVVYYLHGGGYCLGSPETHRGLLHALSQKTRARVLAPDYRLAPEHPHPAAVEDAVAVWQALLDDSAQPERTVIGGDSAGGGLTFATLLKLRDDGLPLPAAAVTLSPWVDLEGTGASMQSRAEVDPMVQREGLVWMGQQYLGGNNPQTPLAAPLHAELAGLPPVLIQVGDWETLLDDATRMHERLRAAGVSSELKVFPEMIHVFQAMTMLPEAAAALDEVAEFVERAL